MRSIEAVTFDSGSTLVLDSAPELRAARRSALKQWVRRHDVKRERYRSAVSSAARVWADWSDVDTRHATKRATDWFAATLGLYLGDSERAELRQLIGDLFCATRYSPAEGVVNALRRLEDQGVPVGIVSNRRSSVPGGLVVRELRRCGIARFFSPAAIAWSDETGCSKPDPRLFLVSLPALAVSPERAAHVGDKKLTDVLGAHRLGMMTIRYTGIKDDQNDGPEADVVIRHHDELAEAVGAGSRQVGQHPRYSVSRVNGHRRGRLSPRSRETTSTF